MPDDEPAKEPNGPTTSTSTWPASEGLDPELGPPDFVFGYGSLIQSASRGMTLDVAGVATPVRVSGLRRSWNVPGPDVGFSATFLGVTEDDEAACNGVIAPVYPNEWDDLDRRERGYDRVVVAPNRVTTLGIHKWAPPEGSRLFVYVAKSPQPPTHKFPIIQSYVDICLDGCLAIDDAADGGESFTREFLESTADWSTEWVNDRLYPRAPFRCTPRAGHIDRLLAEHCPAEFAAMRIE